MIVRLRRASHRQRVFYCWVFIIACVFVAQAGCASGEATQDLVARPNIVILYADDMGWVGTSAYGHPYIRTPSLDRLADEG